MKKIQEFLKCLDNKRSDKITFILENNNQLVIEYFYYQKEISIYTLQVNNNYFQDTILTIDIIGCSRKLIEMIIKSVVDYYCS